VASGRALHAARDDYKNVSNARTIQNALPEAWKSLLEEEDDLLVELIADKVQTITGFKPTPDAVADFIANRILAPKAASISQNARQTVAHSPQPRILAKPTERVKEFTAAKVLGAPVRATTAKDVMIKVLGELHHRDASFLERFAALPRHGRRRRYISRSKVELYPGRPDLCEDCSEQHFGGWWIGTNYSRSTLAKIIQTATEVAGLRFGADVVLE
jgi:hypothetical protein